MDDDIIERLDTKLFNFSDCNPVLYPLVFNIEALSGESTRDYQLYDQVSSFNDSNQNLEQIDLFKEQKYSLQELRLFNKAQLDILLKKENRDVFSERFIQLCDYLENPFHYFLMQHDHESDLAESELLKEFPELLEEIGRDNLVTENEKELLLERATELGLSASKIKHFQNNRFIGYKTFRVLVDQVCEDGIITDREHAFILEKANQYNVPKKIVSKLLKRGLTKAKILKENSLDEDFYTYIISYFTLRFVENSIDKNILDGNLTEEVFNVDSISITSINDTKDQVLMALEESLSTYLHTNIEINDIKVFLRNLGIDTLTKGEAVSNYEYDVEKRTLEDYEKKYTSSTKEFKGFLYQIDYSPINSNELFNYKTKGDEIIINLNTEHPLVTGDGNQLEILEFFLVTLISTKFEYTNNKHVNHFWSLLKLYQQHYTLINNRR